MWRGVVGADCGTSSDDGGAAAAVVDDSVDDDDAPSAVTAAGRGGRRWAAGGVVAAAPPAATEAGSSEVEAEASTGHGIAGDAGGGSAHVEATRYFPKGLPEWTCVALLWTLYGLQCYWFYLIIKVAVRMMATGRAEDVRSDDEDDDPKDQ